MQSSFVPGSEDNDEECTCAQTSHGQAFEGVTLDALPFVPVHVVADPAEDVAEDTEGDQYMVNHQLYFEYYYLLTIGTFL